MSSGRKTLFFSMSVIALGAAIFLPEADSFAAQGATDLITPAATSAEPAGEPTQNIPLLPGAAEAPTSKLIVVEPAAEAGAEPIATPIAAVDPTDPEVSCIAKVVRHEAANQPRTGQLAVAQLIMNRLRSPLFPKTVCGVTNQPGQFFNTYTYNPSRDDVMWKTAWDVAVDARQSLSKSVIGEAIFYNSAGSRSTFHAGRKLAARIGGHAFYY